MAFTVTLGLRNWLRHQVLPFWASEGRDPRTGLFLERFRPDRTPDLHAPLRVRVQFRQVYCFAHAAVLGWHPEGAELALKGWETARTHFWDGSRGGFRHILGADGAVLDDRRDSYDHAFAVLALAWLARATGEQRLRDELDDLLAYVDARLTDPDGLLLEGEPHQLPRRQNPQMHWFEAMLGLHDALGHPTALERAARFRAFFERTLFDRRTGTLGEYYTDDWRPRPARKASRSSRGTWRNGRGSCGRTSGWPGCLDRTTRPPC